MTQQPHWWAYILRKPEFKSLFKEPFLTILFTLLLCPFPMESPLTLISSNFNLLLHLSSHNDLTNYSIFKIMLVLYVFPCLIAQLVKNLPALQKTPVGLLGQEDPLKKGKATHSSVCGSAGEEFTCNTGDLGWEDPLEKGKTTHSSIPAWRIPWTVHGVAKVRHNFHFSH